jgi:peptide deformylase
MEKVGMQPTVDDALLEEGDVLELVSENDPVLHQPTEYFDFANPPMDSRKLYLDLARTLRENNGAGLSANQVGLPYSVFVVESPYGFPMGLFNPRIVDTAGESLLEEGCLSFPQLAVKVKRPSIIRIRFAEWNGEVVTKKFEGLTARVMQHEYDHLLGYTMKDRANKIHLEHAMKRRAKLRKMIKQHSE